jgi:MYXO-CTERM domain-containing protein
MFNKALFLFAALFSPAALADGACCNPDEAFCIYTAEEICLDGGGTYYGDGVDCSADFVECEVEDSSMGSTTDPEPEGACCVDDICIDALTENECKYELGTWYEGLDCGTVGAECEGDPDPDPEGACCLDADGDGINECVDAVTNDWCSHNFGTWYAGQDCDDLVAECDLVVDPDLGACCREDTCIDNVPYDECKDVGTWYPGASCDDLVAECDLDGDDLGACCLDEECIETTAEECWADEGAFYGPGSSCDDTFVECCGDDTGTTVPVGVGTDATVSVDASPAVSCSSAGGSRSGLHLMLPLALMGMAAGFRRREVR